ncbi:hypothetical protein SNE40_001092 [Patella caerulea]
MSLIGERIGAQRLYMILPYLNILANTMIGVMSYCIQLSSEAYTSIKRLQEFLLLEELDSSSNLEKSGLRPKPNDCTVEIKDISCKWDKESDQLTLDNINVNVKAGELLAVIGPVGAGKSSLLMALLGELPLTSGNINVKGKVAYVSQQPWIFSGTLRQNITFGQPYDKSKFNKIVKTAALTRDLEIMPDGENTLIGDRGVSLSGGQRARVSLARALYTDADIYLLDDPLSAVDTTVGRHIFNICIKGLLLKNKPCVLVTHQLQYLEKADKILILKEGATLGIGTFNELSKSGIDFASLLKREENEPSSPLPGIEASLSRHTDSSRASTAEIDKIGSALSLTSINSMFEVDAVQLPQEEERSTGTVGYGVYFTYFKTGAGCFLFFLLVLLNLAAQASYIMSDWWLSIWSNAEDKRHQALTLHNQLLSEGYNVTNVTVPVIETEINVYIFTGIILAVFLFGLLRALLFFFIAVRASQKLHDLMFARILRTTINFFDTNPVGRILNRFSKDVGHMDDLLPVTFFDFIQCFLLILGIILVAGIVNPWVFIPTVPLCGLFLLVRRYYIQTSRSVKRLEGTTRSPVFSHLSASLQGLHTIRAFNMEEKFIDEFDLHQDQHTESWYLFLATSRWFAVRLDWLCALFITAVTFLSVVSSQGLDAGLVGLSITYAMALMGMFQWGVRQSAEVENQMISVERVLEYTRLPTEADLESKPDNKPPDNWPQHGIISGEKASLKYAEDSPVILKELNFCIRTKEKVGIVGRTGAGKSSLINMLLRLCEPTGKLMIDGVDICKIGLHDLRRTIMIIPQDPVLFTGTLRRNLDPFDKYDDSSLWTSLQEVELKSAVEELNGGLDVEVSEGGINFSVGQRQLICLARAILRKSKILLIDEATANVDPETDALIQQTIRQKFSQCTVLTIAHRLHTIMDSDRIMVLDNGKIVEFDHPFTLLSSDDGYFYNMVQQTGRVEAEHLTNIAQEAFSRLETGEKEEIAGTKNNSNIADSDTESVSEIADSSKLLDENPNPSKNTNVTEHSSNGKVVVDSLDDGTSESTPMIKNIDKKHDNKRPILDKLKITFNKREDNSSDVIDGGSVNDKTVEKVSIDRAGKELEENINENTHLV